MSNFAAIAAVTAAMRTLIEKGVQNLINTEIPGGAPPGFQGVQITARPPDKARDGITASQVNLYLYKTSVNAAYVNMDMPQQLKPGETGFPPLALNLNYLLSVYGQDNQEIVAHSILGAAMSTLHDHPVLSANEIKAALPFNDLHQQVERVRISQEPLSLEEISKLWSSFQTNHRLSVTYEVTVILIESKRPSKAPLPVLRRGEEDRGVDTVVGFPALDSIDMPSPRQPGARPGDILTLRGSGLDTSGLKVRFVHSRVDGITVEAAPLTTAPDKITVATPNNVNDILPGFYSVNLFVREQGSNDIIYTTNELFFPLIPQITKFDPNPAPRDGSGNVNLTVTCNPKVRQTQRVALLLGDREIAANPRQGTTETLIFAVKAPKPGDYYLRLRVDGADSSLVAPDKTPPQFDETKKVKIT